MRRHVAILVVLAAALATAWAQRDYALPKPQTEWSVGQQVPDFALKDAQGSELRLSSLRGQNVVLIFYRGYW